MRKQLAQARRTSAAKSSPQRNHAAKASRPSATVVEFDPAMRKRLNAVAAEVGCSPEKLIAHAVRNRVFGGTEIKGERRFRNTADFWRQMDFGKIDVELVVRKGHVVALISDRKPLPAPGSVRETGDVTVTIPRASVSEINALLKHPVACSSAIGDVPSWESVTHFVLCAVDEKIEDEQQRDPGDVALTIPRSDVTFINEILEKDKSVASAVGGRPLWDSASDFVLQAMVDKMEAEKQRQRQRQRSAKSVKA